MHQRRFSFAHLPICTFSHYALSYIFLIARMRWLVTSSTYIFPSADTARSVGWLNLALLLNPSANPAELPARVVTCPAVDICRMRAFVNSATRMLPAASASHRRDLQTQQSMHRLPANPMYQNRHRCHHTGQELFCESMVESVSHYDIAIEIECQSTGVFKFCCGPGSILVTGGTVSSQGGYHSCGCYFSYSMRSIVCHVNIALVIGHYIEWL